MLKAQPEQFEIYQFQNLSVLGPKKMSKIHENLHQTLALKKLEQLHVRKNLYRRDVQKDQCHQRIS